MSNVPRGAWITECSPVRELAQERVGGALAPERRDPHVAGVDRRLRREVAGQGLDRGEERRPVAAGEVDAADRSLEQDVAREERRLVADRVGDMAGTVTRSEDHLEVDAGDLERLTAPHRV